MRFGEWGLLLLLDANYLGVCSSETNSTRNGSFVFGHSIALDWDEQQALEGVGLP